MTKTRGNAGSMWFDLGGVEGKMPGGDSTVVASKVVNCAVTHLDSFQRNSPSLWKSIALRRPRESVFHMLSKSVEAFRKPLCNWTCQ